MTIPHSTPVPNILFDNYLSSLKPAELKVLLIIVRQTFGFVLNNNNNQLRKQRDWITISQFQRKTGLSRKAISTAITTLLNRGLISITDSSNQELSLSKERQKSMRTFYACTFQPYVHSSHSSVHKYSGKEKKVRTTKENNTKEIYTKKEKYMQEIKQAGGFENLMLEKGYLFIYDNCKIINRDTLKQYRFWSKINDQM